MEPRLWISALCCFQFRKILSTLLWTAFALKNFEDLREKLLFIIRICLLFPGFDQCFRFGLFTDSGSNPDKKTKLSYMFFKAIQRWFMLQERPPAQQRTRQTWNFLIFLHLGGGGAILACLNPDSRSGSIDPLNLYPIQIRTRNTGLIVVVMHCTLFFKYSIMDCILSTSKFRWFI